MEPNQKQTKRYIDEAFERILAQPDILDVIILNSVGNPVKSTMDEYNSLLHAGQFELMFQKARYIVRELVPEDEVVSLRVRSKYHEYIVTPDRKLTFLVIQNPVDQMQRDVVT